MKKLFGKVTLGIFASMILFSCASNKMTRDDANLAYKEGSYDVVEEYLAVENEKGDKIDLSLDQAMISALKEDYKTSADSFIEIYRQMETLSGEMTAAQMVGASLASEEAIKYTGPTYEFALLDSLTAYNFIKLGDFDSARAMMRRSFNNNKEAFNELRAKLQEIEKESEAAGSSETTTKALEALKGAGIDFDFISLFNPTEIQNGEVKYELSPFVFYLGAILFANDNDFDLAKDWATTIAPVIGDDMVNSIVNIPEGNGSINVVSLADTIVKRSENEKYVNILTSPDGLMLNFKLTWPAVPESNNIVKNVRVTVSSNNTDDIVFDSVVVEDFDNAVRNDVAGKAKGAYIRSLIRNITRKSAAYVGGLTGVEAARQTAAGLLESGIPAGVAYKAFYKAVEGLQAALDSIDNAEHADRRQGAYFPSKARAASIVVAPGVYNVTVEYLDNVGNVLKSEVVSDVEVKAGLPTIVPSSWINTGNIYIPVTEE